MKRECSYCHKTMGEKEPLADPRVTHGVCPSCAPRVLAEAKMHIFGKPYVEIPEGLEGEIISLTPFVDSIEMISIIIRLSERG